MSARPVYVSAIGMTCPVGLYAEAACAAIRAGLNSKEELDYLDHNNQPIVGSAVPDLAPGVARHLRMAKLAAMAIADALDGGSVDPLPIILAGPRGLSSDDQAGLLAAIGDELGVRLDPRRVGFVSEGSPGGYRAMSWARDLLDKGETERCLVCAVDSLICARELLRLDRDRRLLCDDNSDGVIPGEAAAAVMLQREPVEASASVTGLGFGVEPATLENDEPLRAEGLVTATRAVLAEAGLALHDFDFRLSDAAGEGFDFKEQALLPSRLLDQRLEDFPLWLCATALGHTGAAAGLCGLVTAVAAFRRGYAPGPRALACAADEDGARAVAAVCDVRN